MTPRPSQPALISVVIVLVALAILVAATGCNLIPRRPAAPKATTSSLVPHMNGSAYIMDSWVWIGIAITVAGVFLMVFMKEGRLPLALIAAGGAALGIVFALKAVLPWIPWLIGGAIALGLLWLYARYHKKLFEHLWGVKGLGV